MTDFFVGYARRDRERVDVVVEHLRAEGWTVWYDDELEAGERYQTKILQQISAAKIAIVVWSKLSIDSGWVVDEAEYANSLGKLVPVSIDNARPPMGFGGIHTHSLAEWNGTARAPSFQALIRVIRKRLDDIAKSGPTETSDQRAAFLDGKALDDQWLPLQSKDEVKTASKHRPFRKALVMISAVAVAATFGGWWFVSRSDQSGLAPIVRSPADAGDGSGLQSGTPSTIQHGPDPNNPCWVGAVCLWELADFAGRHRTFLEKGEWSLADRDFVGVATSACNSTDVDAWLIGYSAQYGDQELLLQEGQCVSHLEEEARTPDGTSWKSSIKILRISEG